MKPGSMVEDIADVAIVDVDGNLENQLTDLVDRTKVGCILDAIVSTMARMPIIQDREGDAYETARNVVIYFFLHRGVLKQVPEVESVKDTLLLSCAKNFEGYRFSKKEFESLYMGFARLRVAGEYAMRDEIHTKLKGVSLKVKK